MSMNPDPRPGRWLLPLVVLGMATFTWVFVNEVKGIDLSADDTTTTTVTTVPTTLPDAQTTTQPINPDDPGVLVYTRSLEQAVEQLEVFKTEMNEVNTGWDSDPKTLTYAQTETRLNELKSNVANWASGLSALAPPEALMNVHENLKTQAGLLVAEAENAWDGLVNSATADKRRDAATAFSLLSIEFGELVQAAVGTVQ